MQAYAGRVPADLVLPETFANQMDRPPRLHLSPVAPGEGRRRSSDIIGHGFKLNRCQVRDLR
jgi:hypothetical protein